jgi:predicted nucleic acid-binding protein
VDDQECAILVNACRKLESFSTAILTLDHGLTEALVNQRHTLKSLSLTFLETVEEDLRARISHVKEIHCLQRLKASLPRLEDLTLSMDQDFWRTWLAQDLGITSYYTRGASGLREGVAAYMEEPWACLDLKTLSLKGFPLGSTKGLMMASGEPSSSPSSSLPSSSSSSTPVAGSAPNSSRVLSPSSTMASWQPVKDPSENNPAGEDVMAQNFQLLNIASLTKLKSLSLNQNSYERIPTWV